MGRRWHQSAGLGQRSVMTRTAPSVWSANLCGHAACGSEETVILFMRRGERTIAFRIAKSVEAVTQTDVVEALKPILSSTE
jgi:hypothetical protein